MSNQQTAIRNEISEIRRISGRAMRAHERREVVSSRIVKDLKANGTFFKTSEGPFYMWRSDKPQLYSINFDLALTAKIHDTYGINPAEEREFKHLVKALEIEAELRGQKAEIHRLAHYDAEKATLYVSKFDGTMYRLTGGAIKSVPNGTDGIFFWDDKNWESYELVPVRRGRLLDDLIVKSANFSPSGELTASDQEWAFRAYCLAQFFGSLHPTKPILLITGEKGGGKTLCLRKLLKLLFGSKADVSGLEGSKQDGFVAAVCSSSMAVFDNVDGHVGWLPDHLAQLATGIKFQRRKLYTTNESVEFQPQCFVALTSRTPKFIDGRDDVLDRTIVLHTDRREKFSPENDQLRAVLSNRNALWTELLRILNQVVAHLKANGHTDEEVSFRMADFASFALNVAKMKGEEAEASEILEKLDGTRAQMLLSDEPICVGLDDWLKKPGNHRRRVNSSDLHRELGALVRGQGASWPYVSAHAVGQRLSHIATTLKRRYDVVDETDSSNCHWYGFAPKTEALKRSEAR